MPRIFTSASASVTVKGSSLVASKVEALKMATGTVPFDPRLMLLGSLPGLMSMATAREQLEA